MIIEVRERNLSKNNKTPLHYATSYGKKQMEQLLISKGAKYQDHSCKIL